MANEPQKTRAKFAERNTVLVCADARIKVLTKTITQLNRLVPLETGAAGPLNGRVISLAAKTPVVGKSIAESEVEPGPAREESLRRENEIYSLQMSLDLIVGENARLSRSLAERDLALDEARSRLEQLMTAYNMIAGEKDRWSSRFTESDAALAKARSKLGQMKTALILAESQRNGLAAALDEENKCHQTEIGVLNARLEATSSGACAVQQQLTETSRRLLALAAESSAIERKHADEAAARNVADKKYEMLQHALLMKEREVLQLERSRSKLIECTNTLMAAFMTRDSALVRAEEKIKLLTEQFTQVEAKAHLAVSQERIERLNYQLHYERMERNVVEIARDKARPILIEPPATLDDQVKRDGRHSDPIQLHSSETLLASTITF
jgi:chromosome segregation ATPase